MFWAFRWTHLVLDWSEIYLNECTERLLMMLMIPKSCTSIEITNLSVSYDTFDVRISFLKLIMKKVVHLARYIWQCYGRYSALGRDVKTIKTFNIVMNGKEFTLPCTQCSNYNRKYNFSIITYWKSWRFQLYTFTIRWSDIDLQTPWRQPEMSK